VTNIVILSKSKNTSPFENIFLIFLFLESKKQKIKSKIFSEF